MGNYSVSINFELRPFLENLVNVVLQKGTKKGTKKGLEFSSPFLKLI